MRILPINRSWNFSAHRLKAPACSTLLSARASHGKVCSAQPAHLLTSTFWCGRFLLLHHLLLFTATRPNTCQRSSCLQLFFSITTSNLSPVSPRFRLKLLRNTGENVIGESLLSIWLLVAGKCMLVPPPFLQQQLLKVDSLAQ